MVWKMAIGSAFSWELAKLVGSDLQGLLDLLPSKMLLNSQPSYKLYRDSFYLETKKLLKSLF